MNPPDVAVVIKSVCCGCGVVYRERPCTTPETLAMVAKYGNLSHGLCGKRECAEKYLRGEQYLRGAIPEKG